ncbi:hypothetical protein, partial [Salmonella sp. s55004]|uniref:hypothetical protein n=1 Tax=Salmonella sp. s55004 TaxID=3159675 RepID=UPI00397EFEFF
MAVDTVKVMAVAVAAVNPLHQAVTALKGILDTTAIVTRINNTNSSMLSTNNSISNTTNSRTNRTIPMPTTIVDTIRVAVVIPDMAKVV